MPQIGTYIMSKISKKDFIEKVIIAYNNKELEHYLGYQNNVNLIKKWAKISLTMNRNKTILLNNDTLLVMKLKYRLSNPSEKGSFIPNENDYEFYIIKYNKGVI